MAHRRHHSMSAVWSLLEAKRTSSGRCRKTQRLIHASYRSCGHRSVVSALVFTLVGAKRINPAHALVGQLLLGALVLSQMIEPHAA